MSSNNIHKINSKEISHETYERIKNGDVEAFKLVFTSFWNPLLNFTNNYINDISISENILQDTFLYVWENRDKIEATKNLKTYLYTIARNKSLNILKSHSESKKSDENELMFLEDSESINSNIEMKETYNSILESIDSLPDKSKEIFKMSRFDNLTYKEIAKILDISVKTVETQMSRSLKKLRDFLSHLITFLFFIKWL